MSKIKELLKGLGLSDDTITGAEKDDFDVNKAVENFNKSQEEHYQGILRNTIEPEVKDKVHQETLGKFLKQANNYVKKAGVDLSTVEQVPLHEKLDALVEHVKAETQKASGNVKEDFEKLQKENVDLKNQLTEKDDFVKTETERIKNEAQMEITKDKTDTRLRRKFFNIPADKLITKEHSDGIYNAMRSLADNEIDWKLDEKGDVIAFEKGTEKRITGKDDKGKENFLSADDIIKNKLIDMKFWVQSNGQGQQTTEQTTTSGTEPQKSARLIQMEKEIAEQQQAQ